MSHSQDSRAAVAETADDERSPAKSPALDDDSPVRPALTANSAIALAMSLGLCAGYLDVAIIVLRKFLWNPEGYYRIARDFPWSVPAAHAALLLIPGAVLAAMSLLRPGLVKMRAGASGLASLALWGALLRTPMYGWCSLLLAGGLARPIGDAVAALVPGSRRARYIPAGLLVVLGVLALASSGRQVLRESRAIGTLPAAPPGGRNVILIVWDTVRAQSLGLYGYERKTTPNLAKWSVGGVIYRFALAPAPWTFPSHSSFFTGQWPLRLDSQWKPRLDDAFPTLAEYLATRGYQTAAFVGNTNSCTYETGLDRGFAHFDDYSRSWPSLLSRTVHGRWLVAHLLDAIGDYHGEKWAILQSRDASGINDAFLGWLGRRRADRPFFAFLNAFDAHDSYIPPPAFAGRFGIRPAGRRDYRFLADYLALDKLAARSRDLLMTRDCYDDCIAYLDEQLGRLLDELGRRGLLENTDVIVTSDHGEAFGEYGLTGHSHSVRLEEVRVPLVMISPDAAARGGVSHPVSLRDLPATVVDRMGLSGESPFPGRSLAAHWGKGPGDASGVPATPAFSEQVDRGAGMRLRLDVWPGDEAPEFRMSLVSREYQYIRYGEGNERLYDLIRDARGRTNLATSGRHRPIVESFRSALLDVLNESPGSIEVERVYLGEFRRALEAAVRGGSGERAAVGGRASGAERAPSW